MKHAILLALLTAVAAFPQQQQKFEAAGIYLSKTAPGETCWPIVSGLSSSRELGRFRAMF